MQPTVFLRQQTFEQPEVVDTQAVDGWQQGRRMEARRGEGYLACAGLDASTMDGHDNLLRFRIVGRLFFDDLLPLVPQPPFAIGRAFEVVRVVVESGHRWIEVRSRWHLVVSIEQPCSIRPGLLIVQLLVPFSQRVPQQNRYYCTDLADVRRSSVDRNAICPMEDDASSPTGELIHCPGMCHSRTITISCLSTSSLSTSRGRFAWISVPHYGATSADGWTSTFS